MARADEMLLCANCQANVFVLTQEEEADRHRERETRRKQTWLWPTRLYRRHSCSLWRKSGRRRPGPRRADCWPGRQRQSGLRPCAIKAGNRDPEPLLPICKSRASFWFWFANFFLGFRLGEKMWTTGGRFNRSRWISQEATERERERETRERNPEMIMKKIYLKKNVSLWKWKKNSWKMLSFVVKCFGTDEFRRTDGHLTLVNMLNIDPLSKFVYWDAISFLFGTDRLNKLNQNS